MTNIDIINRIVEFADEIKKFPKERYIIINVPNTPINQYVKQKLDVLNYEYAQNSPD